MKIVNGMRIEITIERNKYPSTKEDPLANPMYEGLELNTMVMKVYQKDKPVLGDTLYFTDETTDVVPEYVRQSIEHFEKKEDKDENNISD